VTFPGLDHRDAADPRFLGAVDLLRRSGASGFQIRYSDDQQPVVWIAVSSYNAESLARIRRAAGRHVEGESEHHAVAAGLTPLRAVFQLCEDLIDGGHCAHCGKPTAFLADTRPPGPVMDPFCCYQWNPQSKAFRRACQDKAR